MAKPVILVVDDDAAVLGAIERDLKQHYRADYRVIKAGSGAEGLEAAKELAARNTPVALFLVDQRMPGMTGIELLREATQAAPGGAQGAAHRVCGYRRRDRRHQRDRARSLPHEAVGSAGAAALSGRSTTCSRNGARACGPPSTASGWSAPSGRRRPSRQGVPLPQSRSVPVGGCGRRRDRCARSRNRSPAD